MLMRRSGGTGQTSCGGSGGSGGRSLFSTYISGLKPVVCQAHRLARADPERHENRGPVGSELPELQNRTEPALRHGPGLLGQQQLRPVHEHGRRGQPRRVPAARLLAARAAEEAAPRARARRRHHAGGEEEPADEGQRPRTEPDAQPERRAGRAAGGSARLPGRDQTHQNRDSALRPQLHLGPVRDHPDRGPAGSAGPVRDHPDLGPAGSGSAQPVPQSGLLLLELQRLLVLLLPGPLRLLPGQPRGTGGLPAVRVPQLRAGHLLTGPVPENCSEASGPGELFGHARTAGVGTSRTAV